jgi:hypothetical protein
MRELFTHSSKLKKKKQREKPGYWSRLGTGLGCWV